jgi:ADP-heptose:LPS heptosyltransferase
MKFPASSILVIRMSGIGDVLWTTPMLANLRMAYPTAHIAYVVRPSSALVLENNPHIDEIILFEKEDIRWQLGFLSRLRKRRFDLSIDLICSPATAIQSVVCGAHTRIGYDFRGRKYLYNHRLSAAAANHGHEVEFNLFALNYMGVAVRTRSLVWSVSEEERTTAQRQWKELGFDDSEVVVGLIPTGGFPSKKWPLAYWKELTHLPELRDVRFLVFWGSDAERRDAEEIASSSSGRIMIEPPGTLRKSAALMECCSAFVGNDSGPLHIATAHGKPVVALYGPTRPASQGPWSDRAVVLQADDIDAICCRRVDCPDPVCMKGIAPSSVARALQVLLADTGGTA